MACLWILVLGLAAGASASSSRIIGGVPALIAHHPWMVQVENLISGAGFWRQNCAGNILTTRFILSAAHCFEGSAYSPRLRRIRAGSDYMHSFGVVAYVEQEFNHPTYGQLGYDGDITVVKLMTPLHFTTNIGPATIVAQGSVIPEGLQVLKAGWGAETESGWPSGQLREVVVYTINNTLCRDRYQNLPPAGGHIVTRNMICAGILDVGGKGSCTRDAGGPVYFNMMIIGIISWGHDCGSATYPGVSTNVGSYTNWIVSTVQGS